MYIAKKFYVVVVLCPHMSDDDLKFGWLEYDVCIKNIKIKVDSRNAYCSWGPDKDAIHAAIGKDGFIKVNNVVEGCRLDNLLTYDVDKIEGNKYSNGGIKGCKRRAVVSHLVPSITLMVDRVHSITADELPKFDDYYHGSDSELSDPIKAFCEWKEEVKNLIAEKESKENGCLKLFTNNCC